MSARAAPARRVATRVLYRVERDGAWATPTLDAEIRRAGLDRRDAALSTEIVYGSLRVLPRLDAVVDALLSRPRKTDAYLRAALRVAAYQLLYLSRVPAHAAVSDAVSLVRSERGPRLAGVANAVLRKVARARPERPEPPATSIVPAWIEAELRASLGPERARAFLEQRPLPPPIGLRAVGVDRASVASAIRASSPEGELDVVAPSEVSDRALALRGAGDPRALPGFEEGAFAVQELGSQRVVELVEAGAGERIADLCCGHGTKSLALAEKVGAGGRVEAADLYEEKLERLERERARLGLPAERVGARAVDLTVGAGGLPAGGFDRVLLDAPCTGLGTIHRRPELALRLTADDPERLAGLQLRLLETARTLVRAQGLLVYAVCSPTRAEGPQLAERFERAHPELAREAGPPADADGVLRLGPWEGRELDAYQVVRWRVRAVRSG